MKKTLSDIYLELQLEGLFDDNKTLYLLDLPNEDMLKNMVLKPKENELYVFARGYNDDLKVGSLFNVIFPSKQPGKFAECHVELKYVSVNHTYELNYLPRGYSGICLLNFFSEVPIEILNKLAKYDLKRDSLINDTLILTQREVINKINIEMI